METVPKSNHPPDEEEQPDRQRLWFIFFDGKAAYGVPPDTVSEVVMKVPVTKVPFTPDWLDGVVSIRGKIIPVMDLFSYFHLPPDAERHKSRLIMLDMDGNSFAVWSDNIAGVEAVSEKDLERPLSNLPAELVQCASAQFRREDWLVHCLDVHQLLEDAKEKVRFGG